MGLELDLLNEIESLLGDLWLSNGPDTWEFILDRIRIFSIKNLRELIDINTLANDSQEVRWNKLLPKKVNISSCRSRNERLPTLVNLDKRGIDLNSTRCPICDDAQEMEFHLFGKCRVAKEVWSNVFEWWS